MAVIATPAQLFGRSVRQQLMQTMVSVFGQEVAEVAQPVDADVHKVADRVAVVERVVDAHLTVCEERHQPAQLVGQRTPQRLFAGLLLDAGRQGDQLRLERLRRLFRLGSLVLQPFQLFLGAVQ